MKKILLFISLNFLLFKGLIAQLSPGDLSIYHAQLEGLSNCTKCHELGEKVTNEKCLDCHHEIKNLITQNKGYHVSEVVKGKDCFQCHNEHHGRNFQLIRFDHQKFDHNYTGYTLEGKHKQLKCNDCHKAALIQKKISKKKEGSYLGLGTECFSCHADYHQNTLPSDCKSCHGLESFSPAVKFQHQKTKFPLVGKHIEVSCEKCHKIEIKNEKKFQRFTGIAFDNCTSCHIDVHNNKFGQDCHKCHSEQSFHQVAMLSNFDHKSTNFPLIGKHQKVDCKSCHKESFVKSIPHKNCTDCHSDYHKGQLVPVSGKYDCKNCHNENGFTPSYYSIEKHNQSKFRLEGSHLATPCFQCHQKNQRWEFKKIGEKCIDCHKNIHQGFISPKYMAENKCENCHNSDSWSDIDFDHGKTNFVLSGKHRETTCRNCHFKKEGDSYTQHFQNLTMICENCHNDPHREQFKKAGSIMCQRCHGYSGWLPSLFNHDSARFKLEGSHLKISCIQCHKKETDSKGSYTMYKTNKEITCADCHLSR